LDPSGSTPFDLVRRGYDRSQVEEHLASVATQLAELRVAAQRERRRAEWAEHELGKARAQLGRQSAQPPVQQPSQQAEAGAAEPSGFGYRVERLLRAAENEASEVRSSAAREATALLERAREDAEAHRHHVEQKLIVRIAALDEQGARRGTELNRREQEVGERIAAARDESDRMLAEVRLESDLLRQEAQDRVARERTVAEEELHERRVCAERELDRLRGMHDEVRAQLARLLESLANEFGGTCRPPLPRSRAQIPPRPRPHPRPRSAPSLEEATLAVAHVIDTQPGPVVAP
jgi:cell division septum initiation protein DivIVA